MSLPANNAFVGCGKDLSYDPGIDFSPSSYVGQKERAKRRFLRQWGINEPGGEYLQRAFMIGVTEWSRRDRDSKGKMWQFVAAGITATVAATLATGLSAAGHAKGWAALPAAIAAVASSLLASFGLRENSGRLRLMARELGFEIVLFANGYEKYRDLKDAPRIDAFMAQIEKLSIRSVFDVPKTGTSSGPETPRNNKRSD